MDPRDTLLDPPHEPLLPPTPTGSKRNLSAAISEEDVLSPSPIRPRWKPRAITADSPLFADSPSSSAFHTPPTRPLLRSEVISSSGESVHQPRSLLDRLDDDAVKIIYSYLKANDIARLSCASPRFGRLARSHLGFRRGEMAVKGGEGATQNQADGVGFPMGISTCSTTRIGSRILIPVLEEGPACFEVARTDADSLRLTKETISLGSLHSPWRALVAPSIVIGSKIYFFGGIYATKNSQLPSFLFPETVDSSVGIRHVSDKFYVLDTDTWILDEIGPMEGSNRGGSTRGKGKSPGNLGRPLAPRTSGTSAANNTDSSGSTGLRSSVVLDWPPGLWGHSMSAISDRWIVIFGGRRSNSEGENDCFVYDLETSSWTWPNVVDGTAPRPRFGHASCDSENSKETYIFGGAYNDPMRTVFNDLHVLTFVNPSCIQWRKFLPPNFGRSRTPSSRDKSKASFDTESIASTQPASQSSFLISPNNSVAQLSTSATRLPPSGPSRTPATPTPSSSHASVESTISTTGFHPHDRIGASMIRVGSNRLIILGGRTIEEVPSPDGAKVWDESMMYSLEAVDVFNVSLNHWSKLDVGISNTSGVGAVEKFPFLVEWALGTPLQISAASSGREGGDRGSWRIPILGLRIAVEDLKVAEVAGGTGETLGERKASMADTELAEEDESQALETLPRSFSRELPDIERSTRGTSPSLSSSLRHSLPLPLPRLFRLTSHPPPHPNHPFAREDTPDVFNAHTFESNSPPPHRYLTSKLNFDGSTSCGPFLTQIDIRGGTLCSVELRRKRGGGVGEEQSFESSSGSVGMPMSEDEVVNSSNSSAEMAVDGEESSQGSSVGDWRIASVRVVPITIDLDIER